MSKSFQKKNFENKKIKPFSGKSKEKPFNKDAYYNQLYTTSKGNDPNFSQFGQEEADKSFIRKNGLLKVDNGIDFGQALELLHNHLYSFKLDDE